MTDGNDLSYPFKKEKQKGIYTEITYNYGLTKREHFAAMALQGLCASGVFTSPEIQIQCEESGVNVSEFISISSVDIADALIEELNKQP